LKYALAYISAIVAANYGFSVIDPWFIFGAAVPPMTFLVGVVFVLRDYAQRSLGHWVFAPMLIGVGLSFVLADPFIATASAVAFAISELVDWAIYTWSRRPFRQRILLSSAASTPLDSAVFLLMIGHFSVAGVILMTLAKMVGALIVWRHIQQKELAHANA